MAGCSAARSAGSAWADVVAGRHSAASAAWAHSAAVVASAALDRTACVCGGDIPCQWVQKRPGSHGNGFCCISEQTKCT